MKKVCSRYLVPRLKDILFIAVFLMVLFLGQRMLNMDGDLPRHLLTGKYIIETHQVPSTEPYAYPYAGRPYVSHEWLADVIFYLVYLVWGLSGIVVIAAILLASTFSHLFLLVVNRTNFRLFPLLMVAWGIGITSLNWVTRPHLFSMLFMVIWLGWVDGLAFGKKVPLWWFPAMMLVWANTHGEFIAGMLILAAYSAGWIWDFVMDRGSTSKASGKKLLIAFFLSLFASALNPAGIGPWLTIFRFVNNNYLMSRMAEANPPDFQQRPFLILLGMLVFSIFLLGIKKERISTGRGILLAGFSAMSLMAARNIHLYGIVAPFVLVDSPSSLAAASFLNRLENIIRNIERRLQGILWPSLAVLSAIFAMLFHQLPFAYHFDKSFFPVEAVQWLKKNPYQEHIFNNLDWGGYIAFQLWPSQSVFVDSMSDVTGEVTQEYETVIMLANGWEDIFWKYQIELVIMPPESVLAKALGQDSAWVKIYQDDTAVIYHK